MLKFITRTGILVLFVAALLTGCAPAQENPPAGATSVPATVESPTLAPVNPGTDQATALPTAAVPLTGEATAVSSGDPAGEVEFALVPDKSQVLYKVREQLARLNLPSDAVGQTSSISGSVFIQPDGSVDSAKSKFTVDLATLQTDQAMRDNYVRRNVLQTDQYPQATFVPTQISGLPEPLPQSGNVTFQVTGDLTIRDVTKPVTWDVTGSIQNGEATGTATTHFTFEDFNLTQPRVPVVLSVDDTINLEADVVLKQVTH
jgi:polyisoprenoid-binding protein YceI